MAFFQYNDMDPTLDSFASLTDSLSSLSYFMAAFSKNSTQTFFFSLQVGSFEAAGFSKLKIIFARYRIRILPFSSHGKKLRDHFFPLKRLANGRVLACLPFVGFSQARSSTIHRGGCCVNRCRVSQKVEQCASSPQRGWR